MSPEAADEQRALRACLSSLFLLVKGYKREEKRQERGTRGPRAPLGGMILLKTVMAVTGMGRKVSPLGEEKSDQRVGGANRGA